MRVVTWNTWWQFDDWEERQPLLGRALAAQSADVVLLQETWPEQADDLAAVCDLEVVECAVGAFEIPDWDGPSDVPFGNAILARPGLATSVGRLPYDSADDVAERVAIAARIAGAGADTLVATTHLNHRSTHGHVRAEQLAVVGAWIDELHATGPVLLGGDLNQTPYSEEYRDAIAGRWVDLWSTVRPDDLGSTMVPDNPRLSYVEWMQERNDRDPGDTPRPPAVRFDYLLARPDRAGEPSLRPRSMHLIGGAEHDWPSDHLGVVADF